MEQAANPIAVEEEAGFKFSELIKEITISEPTIGEVKDAITNLKNGKRQALITPRLSH